MNLIKKMYVDCEKRKHISIPELNIKEGTIIKISVEIAYWRKANAIHNWFVQNVQKGVDNCGDYKVDIEQLRDLYDIVQKVLTAENFEEMAITLLPPIDGFFFGNTGIDEYYREDLVYTEKIPKEILEDEKNSEWDVTFEYGSSW